MGEEETAQYLTFEECSNDYGDGKTSKYYRRTDHILDHTNPVILVGTGRCGSSAVAGMLVALGVYPGRRIQPPDQFNPLGYFEDLEFAVLHDALLAGYMSNKNWKECMTGLIKHRQAYCKSVNTRWFFKDVRTLMFWELYREIFEDLNVVPHIILCQRDLDEVRESMKKTAEYTSDAMIKSIVSQRTKIAESILANYEHLRVWWPDVLAHPKQVAVFLSHYLNLQAADVQLDMAAERIEKKE